MPIEINLLAWAALFGLAQLILASAARTRVYGTRWNVGARDTTPVERATPLIGRLERAQANFLETFPLFAAAVLGAAIGGRLSDATQTGAWLYLAGRLAYLPLYAAGVPVARTLAFGVATSGLLMILLAIIR